MKASLKKTWRNQALYSGEKMNTFHTQNLLLPNKQTTSPFPAASCSFEPMISNTLVSASMSPGPAVNFVTVVFLSFGSKSNPSPFSRATCFRISTTLSSVSSWMSSTIRYNLHHPTYCHMRWA